MGTAVTFGRFDIVCYQGVINKEGERTTDKIVVKTFNRLAQATQFLEENAVEMINDGWKYDYHISREAKPGEKCDFKEWQKDFEDGTRIELFYTID